MKIEVTQEDIDHGVRKHCEGCPVARAIKRVMTGFEVSVGRTISVFKRGASTGSLELPKNVNIWIGDFDNMQPVSPFSFDLDFDPDSI